MHPNADLRAAIASAEVMARAQAAGVALADGWRSRSDVQALVAALTGVESEPVADAPSFAAMLRPWLTNQSWVGAFITQGCATLRNDPLAAVQFRLVQGRVVHGLALLATAMADVTLGWVDSLTLPLARDPYITLLSNLSVVCVIRAGGLMVQHHQLHATPDGDRLRGSPPRMLADGEIIATDGRHECLTMHTASSDAVLLRFNLRLMPPLPERAYDADNGRLIKCGMGDDKISRMMPLLSVPRLAGRAAAAADHLAQLATHPDPVLRWTAMREWLVADTRAAVRHLRIMSTADPDSGVRRAAAATLAIVHPAEAQPCPA